MIKIFICALAKQEEKYINEWLDYYINELKINHIIIGDNNEIDYEPKLEDVIDSQYKGHITIVDVRGQHGIQQNFYNQIYNEYKNEFDWFLPIDIDEFVNINQDAPFLEGTNKEYKLFTFLSLPQFKDFDCIVFPWRYITDSGNLHYENKPVRERFKEVAFPKKNGVGCKTFYRSLTWCNKILSMHCPEYSSKNKSPRKRFMYCNVLGEHNFERFNNQDNKSKFTQIGLNMDYYSVAWIDHYMTKSTEEYIQNKIFRGRGVYNYKNARYTKKFYYRINKITKEKEEIFKQYEDKILNILNNCENFDKEAYDKFERKIQNQLNKNK